MIMIWYDYYTSINYLIPNSMKLINTFEPPLTAWQVAQRDCTLDRRQLSSPYGVAVDTSPARQFSTPKWFSEGYGEMKLLPKSITDMLYKVKVRISGWTIHATNILTFQVIVNPLRAL